MQGVSGRMKSSSLHFSVSIPSSVSCDWSKFTRMYFMIHLFFIQHVHSIKNIHFFRMYLSLSTTEFRQLLPIAFVILGELKIANVPFSAMCAVLSTKGPLDTYLTRLTSL